MVELTVTVKVAAAVVIPIAGIVVVNLLRKKR